MFFNGSVSPFLQLVVAPMDERLIVSIIFIPLKRDAVLSVN